MKRIMNNEFGKLEEANRKLHTLYNNVPGGIIQCLYDENLTLLEMSDGFLNMIGYTREQVQKEVDSSLCRLIDPEDMERCRVEVQTQVAKGKTKEISYRLIHRDGHRIHVVDRGALHKDELGRDVFYCIIMDITKKRQMEREFRLSLERYQIIINQTNDVIFEWDIIEDRLEVTVNWEKRFGARRFRNGESLYRILEMLEEPVFAPEDMDRVYQALRDIKAGTPYLEKEVRIRHEKGHYIWCRVRMTQQLDQDGKPVKVIGVLVDIDRETKLSLHLRKAAEQDALTGMYNKMTTQALIRDYLQNGDLPAVLMIVDIDNFKRVNDTMGHLYGDAVLSNLAHDMRRSFREEDILGRIGGDEFILFLRGIRDEEGAKINANKILRLFEDFRVGGRRNRDISCSIGIAMFPKDGKDFNTLYQRADFALYRAKQGGKNQYAFFDEQSMLRSLIQTETPVSSVTAVIDSNTSVKAMGSELVEYIFRILYHADDVNDALKTILEIVGRHFDVSRVYIFENSEDDRTCTNTFEWCAEGVDAQQEFLKCVDYQKDLGGRYFENFDEKNIFYCPDITKLPKQQQNVMAMQGIKSLLQCAIKEDGRFRGFVGFDECRENRCWTQEQIEVLCFTSKIISTFLLKSRGREQYKRENEELHMILDNQNAWIYVVEAETMALLFLNRKTRHLVPGIELGTTCHKAFMDQDEVCENCPARQVRDACENYTTEFYNPHLDIWSSADASRITWHGKAAILVCCHDISKYKR